ncbi:MAG: UDP-glucose 4-epimerase GalE [Demequinaceae bacterium]|nr:UDP-glucose 4-epimerase GalE [Demequinaceae bacterium]
MTWLVTGGAGYIGSHVVRAFRDAGFKVAVLDDLSTGRASFVPEGIRLVHATLLDVEVVRSALTDLDVTGVVHIAGYKYAGESVHRPLYTWRQNVGGTGALLTAMDEAGVGMLVYSGSAGVYGTPTVEVVTEATPDAPESPYGESKLAAEILIRAQATATADTDHPLQQTSLRFFNVIGSHGEVYDASPFNLLPRVFTGLLKGEAPVIFGDDYPTPDGTCIRDYICASDVALAHVEAARAMEAGRPLEPVYNLGSGTGTSVKEMMNAIIEVTGTDLRPVIGPRRPGDPARIVADGALAARDLGWSMRHAPRDMVASAWAAHPKG